MSARPEILFPLFADLTGLPGIGPKIAQTLNALRVERPRDLLLTLPHSLINRQLRDSVLDVVPPAVTSVTIEVRAHHPNTIKGRPYRITVIDKATEFQLVFFHARKDYLQRLLPVGGKRVVSGKVEKFDNVLQIVHPDFVVPEHEATEIPSIEPVYPLTSGLSQKVMYRATSAILEKLPVLEEWIEPGLKAKHQWPEWRTALLDAHRPEDKSALSPRSAARERLAYDEVFAHQITLALARRTRRNKPGKPSVPTGKLQSKVLKSLPFHPTGAQDRAIREISDDLASSKRMNRLLQGDVGSGKTLVALMALLVAVEAGGQGVMMAPTEILARQHFAATRPMAEEAGIVIELLTGRDKGAERAAKRAAIKRGDIHIVVGTHAVFQDEVEFHDLRLAVIDEQHRFGVNQRMALGRKGQAVDVLVMTATPIPRSLALAQYGDMDISVLDEKPPGRKPIKTVVIPAARTEQVIENLRGAIEAGRQAYWVCPLVEESEVKDWTAAEERARLLRLALGDARVGLVHGQMAGADKDAAMAGFQAGETSVLVATTVIEVGVDVPNATIMVVEQAENFGLAQLHQLRGRVGRGEAESSCVLLYTPPLNDVAEQRLAALRQSEDGFFLAEEDMRLRGAGDVLGVAQSGLPRFRIADLEHQGDLLKIANDDAKMLLESDPTLSDARGRAARVLLWLMEQDKAIQMISVG